MPSRDEQKRESIAYREYLKRRVQSGDVFLSAELRVDQHAAIQYSEDGAFVEIQVWIPRALIQELLDETPRRGEGYE